MAESKLLSILSQFIGGRISVGRVCIKGVLILLSLINSTFTFAQSSAAGPSGGGSGCIITPATPVCPNVIKTYSAPSGMTNYAWSITGGGTITSPLNSKTVTVTAGPNCNTTYRLTVSYINSSQMGITCSQSIPIIDNTIPTISGSPNKTVPNNTPNVVFDTPVINDVCGTPSLVVISTTITTLPDGSVNHTRTWKAVDGCGNSSSTLSQTITVNALIACAITGSNTICTGGTVELCANPGATTYAWSTGATTPCITVSTAGTYSVTVSDASGSSSCSKTVTSNSPSDCLITGIPVICSGGSANLCAPSGATSYLWNTGETTQCISAASPGSYTVTIVEANGCSSSCGKEVTAGNTPVCTLSGSNSICPGGTANICALAGAVSYTWSTGATNQCISVSSPGTYTATVTNASGCSSICNKTINESIPTNCIITGNFLICPGGSTQLCAAAGLSSYSWSTGETTQCITVNILGNYTVTVSGSNGCTASCSQIVAAKEVPACSISGNSSICPGGTTNLCAPANMASYLWSTGATTQCINVTTEGVYSVTITNSDGCSNTCNKTVTTANPPLCSISGNSTICQGGTTNLCAPAGMTAYSWSTGATTQCISVNTAGTFAVTITNSEGCSSTCNKSVTIDNPQSCTILTTNTCGTANLCAPAGAVAYSWSTGATTQCITVGATGTYTVNTTNENGCIRVCNKSVTINSPHPCVITGNSTFCQGGSVNLCGPAGASAYLWSTGATTQCITVNSSGTFSLTATDAIGCNSICSKTVTMNPTPACAISGNTSLCPGSTSNLCATAGAASYLWSTGATTQCITVTNQGNYSVTVTDIKGCTSTCNKNVTVSNSLPCSITGNSSACAGGTLNLCGPVGGITYLWSTGATTQCITVSNSGTYSVTMVDEGGCSNTCSKTVSINSPPACLVTGSTSFCAGGSTNLCAPAGASSYSWSNGATTQCVTINTAGNYSVTITNANGCSSTCTKNVTIDNPPNCSITGNLLICTGGSSNICASVSGASYAWSNGATTQCIDVTNSGNYSVTVTSANGCSSTCSQNIDFLPSPNCNITGNSTICSGTTTNLCSAPGAASYSWSNGGTTQCINVSSSGNYTVLATGVNGCTSTCSKSVTVNVPITCSLTGNSSICAGGSTTLCAPEGGSTYNWSSEATTNCITVNSSGTYSVIITDQNGCISTCSKTVTLYQLPTCTITGENDICQGNNAVFTASGGTKYIWNTGATTQSITVTTPGQYSVNVSNDNGCSISCNRNLAIRNCGISLKKTPDICEFPDGTPTNVNFKYVIKNTGNFFSASGKLTDDNGTPTNATDDIDVCNWGPIAPGDSSICTRAFIISKTHVNTANAAGTSGGAIVSSTSTATVAGINCNCNLNYPDNSNLPRSAVIFNESEVLRASDPGTTTCGSTGSVIKLWYNDEHALLLGVRSVSVKTFNGTTTTNYNITPTPTSPACVNNPLVGDTVSSGDQAANDMAAGGGRPLWPAIFITDLTVNGATSRIGDWQQGGKGIPPTRVCGKWKSAVKIIDKTKNPPLVTIATDVNPPKNNWSLGSGSDTPPGGFATLKDEGYGAEVSWDVNSLGLIPGHTYRLVFMVHDGDQNKTGGDVGEACTTIHISDGNCAPLTTDLPPTESEKICYTGTSHRYVKASQEWKINTTTNQATIRTTFSKNFVDNTFGLSAIGWSNGHKFNDLVGSDHVQMSLYDANNVKKMEFKLDYITSSNTVASGYKCLGVIGGEGQMILGSASDVVSVTTSLDKNLNSSGYLLTTNSPATNNSYTPNATYPNWIYDVWYEVTVKLSAFGSAGFGKPQITSVHASPSKTGSNTELVIDTTCTASSPRIAAPDSPSRINAIAYPNPFGDDVTINFITPLEEDAVIIVTDVAGRIVESGSYYAGSIKMGKNLKPGIYFVRITQGDLYRIIKIIKS